MVLHLDRGDRLDQRKLLRRLADMQYTRNELDLSQGTYRVRGDVIDISPRNRIAKLCAWSCSTTRSRPCRCSTR